MLSRNIWVRVGLIFTAGVLLAGVAAIIGQRETPVGVSIEAFNELLPRANELPSWSASHRPVADTEEMKRAVAKLLNYDAGGFMTYTNGDLQISIYVAYWKTRGNVTAAGGVAYARRLLDGERLGVSIRSIR